MHAHIACVLKEEDIITIMSYVVTMVLIIM
jgi:hypothetical protein